MAGHLSPTRLTAPALTGEELDHLDHCDVCAAGRAFPPVLGRPTAGSRPSDAHVQLILDGFALPAVPLENVVASYTVDLLATGRWVAASVHAVLRVELTELGARLRPLTPGIRVGAGEVAVGDAVALGDGDVVHSPAGRTQFVSVGPGYAGLLLHDTRLGFGVVDGTTVELGREPNHPGLVLPERRGNENLRWCPGPRAEKARALGFSLDRALAGRRHAAIGVHGGGVRLTHLHARFRTYVVRSGSSELERVAGEAALDSGDRVVIGTSVVLVRNR